MTRVYVRKFDWDESRFLHSHVGMTYTELADRYGVSKEAIRLACNDKARALNQAHKDRAQRSGVCVICGCQCSRNPSDLMHGRTSGRCRACAAKARATSVRDDALQCVVCHEWKPDECFYRSVAEPHRRGRHSNCKLCAAAAKRSWRHRNPEKSRAADARNNERRRVHG